MNGATFSPWSDRFNRNRRSDLFWAETASPHTALINLLAF
jgi:hypothetical protein